jgi:hypothetical protein
MKQRRLDTTTSTFYPGQPQTLPAVRHHAQLESDVAVPVLQALAIGMATAIGLAIATLLLGPPVAGIGGGEAWTWAGRLAGSVGGLAWASSTVAFVLQHRRALQPAAAVAGHGNEESEPAEPEVTHVVVTEEDGKQSRYVDLPVGPDKLHKLARACLWHGRPFSRRRLSDVLTQTEYARLAKVMLARGLAIETPTGRELTPAGRAILRKYQ